LAVPAETQLPGWTSTSFDGVMEITVIAGADVDERLGEQIAELGNAASAVDSPHLPPVSGKHERLRLVHGWDMVPTDHLVLAYDGGRLVGIAEVELPRWDNTHLGYMDLQTLPARRGEGIGDRLLETGLEPILADGRTMLLADAWADSHREKFWLRHGLTVGSRAAQRRIVTADLDWPHLDELLKAAREASAGYELIDVPMPTPPDLMDEMIRLQHVMNDAPIDDLDIEDEAFPEERVRGIERAAELRGKRAHRLVARRLSDGELAGHTVVEVEDDRPHLGFQEDTEVVPSHRGHKLGLRMKIEMLQRLRDLEPQITQVDTWNAESNTHMIAVNELLGCVVVGRGVEMQKQLTQ
jgi:GNAT superfamily N-acetyltransferase